MSVVERKQIYAAIATAMGALKKLAKADFNKFDNYNFTSIDSFLAATSEACSDNGLVILQDETECTTTEKKGKQWLKLSFAFQVCHQSGEALDVMHRSVAVPFTGAQAFGSAQSYALKQFLRSLFQISTGDKDDPDFQPSQSGPALQVPKMSDNQKDHIESLVTRHFLNIDHFKAFVQSKKSKDYTELNYDEANNLIKLLELGHDEWPDGAKDLLETTKPTIEG